MAYDQRITKKAWLELRKIKKDYLMNDVAGWILQEQYLRDGKFIRKCT